MDILLRNAPVGTASVHPQWDFHNEPDKTNSEITGGELDSISALCDIERQITGRPANLSDGFRSPAANTLQIF
jgi:hypothetical protein